MLAGVDAGCDGEAAARGRVPLLCMWRRQQAACAGVPAAQPGPRPRRLQAEPRCWQFLQGVKGIQCCKPWLV